MRSLLGVGRNAPISAIFIREMGWLPIVGITQYHVLDFGSNSVKGHKLDLTIKSLLNHVFSAKNGKKNWAFNFLLTPTYMVDLSTHLGFSPSIYR